jgi:hypothetical protein
MKLKEMFKFAVKEAIKVDPRNKKEIGRFLAGEKKLYRSLSPADKKLFDRERFWNPYPDCRVYHGTGHEEVKSLMVGIDMETPELLLADRLREKGLAVDLVLAHHPEGIALTGLPDVMHLQENALKRQGVPLKQAQRIFKGRIEEVHRRVHPANATRAGDAAKLLGLPFANLHTVGDNHVNHFLQKYLNRKKPKTLAEVVKALKALPEYQWAESERAGPTIFSGKPSNKAGKIYVDMTGGTEGPPKCYEKLAKAGVKTTVEMHASDKKREAARKANMNVVVAGHMASDTLGMNLVFDKLEKEFGRLNFIEVSGFKRFRRLKGKK